jgi:PilZ domain
MMPGPIMQVGIIDISGSGMRLHSRLPVPCGTHIEIELSSTVARGSVCRCEPGQDSYELGVQISETAPKS